MSDVKKERILVTVKTYPTISSSYVELVCTAGLNEDGQWIRLYPIQFRARAKEEQYRKFDWIECELIRNSADFRIESHKPFDPNNINQVDHIGTENGWKERNDLVLEKAKVYEDLKTLIESAKKERISLAVYKPKEISDLIIEEDSGEYDERALQRAKAKLQEKDLFEDDSWKENFEIVRKLPRSFSYKFVDQDGSTHTMRILDWEIGALFWKSCDYQETKYQYADEQVRKKYWDEFKERNVLLFLGTTLQYHMMAANPFTIVGVYYPPNADSLPLFEDNSD